MPAVLDPPVSILDYADMLPLTSEEVQEGRDWLRTADARFASNMARNATLAAYEMGAISAPKALYALIENNALDYDLVMGMILAHARASAIIEGD